MKVLSALLVLLVVNRCYSIENRDLYDVVAQGSVTLPRGDEESVQVHLQTPINFYTEKYDSIYINTNGILTFLNEFPEFLNIPFPIEYPSISPFYSNIDTTDADGASKISYYQTTDSNLLSRASSGIREAFSDAQSFQAKGLFVVTWNNVAKWRGESRERLYEKNTFQVAVTSSDDESYVEFLYPQGGIQWVKAESGESGLPDIRARAGFVASDGRYVGLKGSGTDRVRHLSETSNYGQPGRWLYRVGKLDEGESVEEPDSVSQYEEAAQPLTCASGGRLQCHSAATCEDTQDGFCCKCKDGFYGNGNSCIMNSVPIRITGHINGRIGSSSIASQLQSYIVMVDGRSYTAVSALTTDLGLKVQLLEIIGGVIGWLFAKPVGSTLNGYQITGGKFNHTSSIRFTTGENLHITQRYVGLNLWDQLAAEIEVSGDVPLVPEGIKLSMEDFIEEYSTSGPNTIQSVSNQKIQLSSGGPDISYTIHQSVKYESCAFVEQAERDNNINGRLKTSKIQLGFFSQEKAVRISTVSKVGLTDRTNPCFEGTANCGDNTICVPTPDDSYECQCKNGFTFAAAGPDSESQEICVDIDECSSGHICSEFAQCNNRNGGYECVCFPGYEGNGYDCQRVQDVVPIPRPRPDVRPQQRPQPQHTTQAYDQCRDCSEHAFCQDGRCVCRSGFTGNGLDCRMICALNEVFNGVTCVKPVTVEEDEITPYCTPNGCVCPRGYQMIEYVHKTVCRYDDTEGPTQAPVSCDVYDNCHREHGHCEFDQSVGRFECVCDPGFDGNGIECTEIDTNCKSNPYYCDRHADCIYNSTTRENVCVCQRGFEGNGRVCSQYRECESAVDCGHRSVCRYGTCECEDGYEKDDHDFCVPSGLCNGAYCAENAHCLFDQQAQVNYCHCPPGFIGDGVLECKSIPPPCNVRNNCGLFATCSPNYRTSTYECACNDGYTGDGFVCLLESNCHNIPELCDRNANCTSTSSGWKCVCNQGFVGNGSVCNPPPTLESGFLLVSHGVAVVKLPLSTGRKKGVPVSTASMAIGVDKDCAEGRVYWSDISAKAILTSKYDGSDKKTFIDTDIHSPEGVAVDWVSRRIYWTDSGKDTIEVASLENATVRSVLINRGLVNPRGIAVDPHQNKIFWSDWNRHNPKIEWANLDGSDRETLVSAPNVKLPNSLALSLSSGEICYADAGNFKIECLDTYSKQPRIIAENLKYPFGLAITDEHFFWSDWNTTMIESIDFNGSRQAGIQTTHFTKYRMYGITAVVDRCPIYFSACNINNGDCPSNHICLVNPRMPSGRSCKCITQAACNINDIDSEFGAHYA